MNALYKWSMLVAAPGTLWAAFELYGLTLSGPQMLFFSISHVLPFMLLALWVAVPCFILWSALTLAALASAVTRQALGLSARQAAALLTAQAYFVASLLGYERWSASLVKPFVCVFGLASMLVLLVLSSRWLLRTPSVRPIASHARNT